ncbi:hypothetical protein [Latilactobacillus curvatus]|uniref:hypothetical protein n=1 Tax=Latilactobacillus curvatus TaxID=28038 RepID=UPI0039AF134D
MNDFYTYFIYLSVNRNVRSYQSFNKRIKSETETLMMAKANLEKLKAGVSARD